jgi:hypothetical protein
MGGAAVDKWRILDHLQWSLKSRCADRSRGSDPPPLRVVCPTVIPLWRSPGRRRLACQPPEWIGMRLPVLRDGRVRALWRRCPDGAELLRPRTDRCPTRTAVRRQRCPPTGGAARAARCSWSATTGPAATVMVAVTKAIARPAGQGGATPVRPVSPRGSRCQPGQADDEDGQQEKSHRE